MSAIDQTIAKEAGTLIQEGVTQIARHTPKQQFARNIGLESLGFAIAEGVSMATALGVVAVADKIAPTPIKAASQLLSKTLIEPNLDLVEKAMGKVCKLEECQVDKSKPREERAEKLAHTLLIFSTSWVAGMGAKIQTRRSMNRVFDIPLGDDHGWKIWKLSKKEKLIFASDEVVHYGSLLALNTVAAPETDDLIRTTTGILTKMGVSKDKAHELASYSMIWELPNLMGLLSGLGAVYATHKYPEKFGIKPGT